jgi:hypothetical protein
MPRDAPVMTTTFRSDVMFAPFPVEGVSERVVHQRTECGFASIAQLLSFFATGTAAILPMLRRCVIRRPCP